MSARSEQTERSKLIKELNKFGFDDTLNCCADVKDVVNFIIADRKRIVAPLVEFMKNDNPDWIDASLMARKLLENAGVDL